MNLKASSHRVPQKYCANFINLSFLPLCFSPAALPTLQYPSSTMERVNETLAAMIGGVVPAAFLSIVIIVYLSLRYLRPSKHGDTEQGQKEAEIASREPHSKTTYRHGRPMVSSRPVNYPLNTHDYATRPLPPPPTTTNTTSPRMPRKPTPIAGKGTRMPMRQIFKPMLQMDNIRASPSVRQDQSVFSSDTEDESPEWRSRKGKKKDLKKMQNALGIQHAEPLAALTQQAPSQRPHIWGSTTPDARPGSQSISFGPSPDNDMEVPIGLSPDHSESSQQPLRGHAQALHKGDHVEDSFNRRRTVIRSSRDFVRGHYIGSSANQLAPSSREDGQLNHI